MNYLIIEKETEELIDLIDLSKEDKIVYEKKHPKHLLEIADEAVFFNDEDDDEW